MQSTLTLQSIRKKSYLSFALLYIKLFVDILYHKGGMKPVGQLLEPSCY